MYWFLEFLGLDEKADRRSIKKSYAKLLKRIDQTEDQEGFSQLRDAYETALAWEENRTLYDTHEQKIYQAEHASNEDNGASNRLLDSSKELKSIITEWEKSALEISLTTTSSHQALRKLLDRTLKDGRLLNLEDRSQFENYLVSSYRNPHTPLRAISFLQAAYTFNWFEHSPHLESSENGRWILGVLEERLMWKNQHRNDSYWQEIALNTFTRDSPLRQKRKVWKHLVIMARDFPLWFGLWIDFATLQDVLDKYPTLTQMEVLRDDLSRITAQDVRVILFSIVATWLMFVFRDELFG